MKKLSLLLLAGILLLGCNKSNLISERSDSEQTVPPPSQNGSSNFFSIVTYQRIDSFILAHYGTVDTSNFHIDTILYNGVTYFSYLYNIFESSGELIAQLNVVDLDISSSDSILPYNDAYAMQLIDYSGLSMSDTSGSINFFDLNWDSHHFATIHLNENQIVDNIYFELMTDLKHKFPYLISDYHPCDYNSDNNISYVECYKCLKDAIDANGGGKWFCDSPFGALPCWISISASCVIIASKY